MTGLLVKLQPNQDVTEALEKVVALAGFGRATIVAAVGSLVEGILERGDGIEVVNGPAIEVAALSGTVFASGGSTLRGFLCRDDTSVAEGRLARGRNSVAVTFELLLEAE